MLASLPGISLSENRGLWKPGFAPGFFFACRPGREAHLWGNDLDRLWRRQPLLCAGGYWTCLSVDLDRTRCCSGEDGLDALDA